MRLQLIHQIIFASAIFLSTHQEVLGDRDHELFWYGTYDTQVNGINEYGQPDWSNLQCSDPATCTSWLDVYQHPIGWTIGSNNCKWCPEGGSQNCGLHQQSPINLKRDVAIPNSTDYHECKDWHHQSYYDDSCSWADMVNQFTIERHALRVSIPILPNGDIDCVNANGTRIFGRFDWSKGFQDWWWLQRFEITTPGQHEQEGVKYDAEVTLEHVYSVPHPFIQIGLVSVMLKAWPNTTSWAYLDKLICAWRKEEERIRSDCGYPPAPPYGRCALFRGQTPTAEWLAEAGLASAPTPTQQKPSPTPSPTQAPVISKPVSVTPTQAPAIVISGSAPPPIDCNAYDAPYERMCFSSDPCCESTRSDSDFCWQIYDNTFPGNLINSACYYCCPGQAKVVGPPNPPNPNGIAQTLKCSSVPAQRMCKADSCCSNPRSTSGYCTMMYQLYGEDINQICWYCCRDPLIVGPARRNLRLAANVTLSAEQHTAQIASIEAQFPKGEDATNDLSAGKEVLEGNFEMPDGARIFNVQGKKYLLRKENFERKEDDEKHFERIFADYKRRTLQQENAIHDIDYDDVYYWPYEWMIKVNTEYYFKYQGSQLTAPCRDNTWWHVMKDPIRVHQRQIDEINRLLAWRIAPRGAQNECNHDTAGIVSSDGTKVSVNRNIQYTTEIHRLVFCECSNWPSKFESDQKWCKHWKTDTNYTRFFEHPYNFDSGGKWAP